MDLVTVLSLHRNQVQYPNCLLLYNGTGGSSLSGMSSSELRLFNRDFLLKKNLRYTWLWWKDLVNQSSKHLIGQWPSPSAADAARADCKSRYSEQTTSYCSIKDHVFHLEAEINHEDAIDQGWLSIFIQILAFFLTCNLFCGGFSQHAKYAFMPYPACPTSVTDRPSVFLLETLLNFSLAVNFSLLLEYQSIIS